MPDFDDVASRYIQTWNERDPALRSKSVADLWATTGHYSDPLVDIEGHHQIDTTIATVQSQFPNFKFRLTGPVDGHGLQCRFSWELGPEDGESPVAGFDVAVLDRDGKLQTVLGFLDRVPADA